MKELVYYSLHHNTEWEKIGVWPQLEPPKRYWKVENNYDIALDYRKFPEVAPNLDNFTLKRAAKRTDVLSAEMPGVGGNIGMFVNEKFKTLVENYTLKNFRFYDCKLLAPFDKSKEPELFNFNYLNFIHTIDLVDLKKSVFNDLKIDQMVTVENDEQRDPFLRPRKLFLKEAPDLFCAPYDTNILVSKRLKTAIEEAGITGVWFEDRMSCEYYTSE